MKEPLSEVPLSDEDQKAISDSLAELIYYYTQAESVAYGSGAVWGIQYARAEAPNWIRACDDWKRLYKTADAETAKQAERIAELEAEVAALKAEQFRYAGLGDADLEDQVRKLTAFKKYVHDRLDAAGIPSDPESPHKAAGCRIGGRLDLVLSAGSSPAESDHWKKRWEESIKREDIAGTSIVSMHFELTRAKERNSRLVEVLKGFITYVQDDIVTDHERQLFNEAKAAIESEEKHESGDKP